MTTTQIISEALRKTGIEVQTWTEEEAQRALGSFSSEYLHRISASFDEQLQLQARGLLNKNHVYNLGFPGEVLLSTGVPNVPIQLKASRLNEKSSSHKHPFELSEIKGLVEELQHPIAIFTYGDATKAQNIIIGLQYKEKNFLVGLSLKPTIEGVQLEINSVRNVFPKTNEDWLRWIRQYKALYLDKERIQNLIAQQRINHADVGYQILDSIANIVKNFENPKFFKQIQPVPNPVFYSNAALALQSIKQDKGTPAQWLAMLTKAGGIKAGEDKWTGLSQWLRTLSQPSLTKEDIQAFLQQNQLEVKEVLFSMPEKNEYYIQVQHEFEQIIKEVDEENIYEYQEDVEYEAFLRMADIYGDDFENAFGHSKGKLYIADTAYFPNDMHVIQDIRFQYTTKGLDDYNELAFYTENTPFWNYEEDVELHFQDVGGRDGGQCIAWVRFGIKAEQDHKVLLIDEIQSTRHQSANRKGLDGEKIGYRDENAFKQAEAAAADSGKQWNQFYESMMNKYNGAGYKQWKEEDQSIYNRLNDIHQQNLKILDSHEQKPPIAPFEKNWHELCMKRMLRYAAENGLDKIAWTTGQQQVERYRIGENVNVIYSQPYEAQSPIEENGFDVNIITDKTHLYLFVNNDGIIINGTWGERSLEGMSLNKLIGTHMEKQILSSKEYLRFDNIEGNIRIGEKGMNNFYDVSIPSFMNKYGKNWGVRTHDFSMNLLGKEQIFHAVDVTPAMKESVLQGQPMFMMDRKGKVLGLTLGDRIFLTPKGFNPETMVHEYTHVWATAMQYGNPEGWQSIKDLLKDTSLWEEVKNDPYYADIRNNDNHIASEVLARISGKENAAKLDAMARKTAEQQAAKGKPMRAVDVLTRIKTALDKFWSWVGKHMFDIEQFHSVSEVTDRVLYDLAKGTKLETGRPVIQQPSTINPRITHAAVFYQRGHIPFIRCKIDGRQMTAVPVKEKDWAAVTDRDRLDELAQDYFKKHLVSEQENVQARKRR